MAQAVDLNLTSTNQNLNASDFLSSGSVNVSQVDSPSPLVVTSGSTLTPAQYVAAMQIVTTGTQSLNINSAGQATGGTFVSNTINNLSGLNVPSNVTGIHNFASNPNLNLTGNLVNSGTLYAVSTNPGVTTANIGANAITNNVGALLTSVLPQGGLAGFSGAIAQLNLNLTALTSIINNGTISSSGSLTMNAGTSILNTNVAGNTAVMQAMSTVNAIAANITNQGQIQSILNNIAMQTDNLTNSGTIAALGGDLDIQTLVTRTLTINNVNGLLSSTGSLTFDAGSPNAANQITLLGGSAQANDTLFSSRNGRIDVVSTSLSNVVDVDASTVNLAITGGTSGLTLTGINRATNSSLSYTGVGDVIIPGLTTNGGSININTTGSITVVGIGNGINAPDLDTTAGAAAGNVSLIAGGTISLRDVDTSATGTGGNITIQSGGSMTARDIIASGANAGSISIQAGTGGTGDATVTSVTAVGNNNSVSLLAPGMVSINTLNAPGTDLTISQNYSIPNLNIGSGGTVNVAPQGNGPWVVDFSQLGQLFAGSPTVQLGNSGSTVDIIVNTNCNQCFGNSDVTFATGGRYIATGTTITLGNGADLQISGGNGVNTGNVNGGNSVSFNSNGDVTVDGDIRTNPGGNVVLRGNAFGLGLGGRVDTQGGSVRLMPNANSNAQVNLAGMNNVFADSFTVGDGVTVADVTLNGNGDLSNVTGNVSFLVNGNFRGNSSNLTVGGNSDLNVVADSIRTGGFNGGRSFNFVSDGLLDVTGDLVSPGAVNLAGDQGRSGQVLNIGAGRNVTGASLDISSGRGNIGSAGRLNATVSDLNMNSGGSLAIIDNSSLNSMQDMALTAMGDIDIGSSGGTGVAFSSGSMNGGVGNGPMAPGSVTSSGAIRIDNYLGGQGLGLGSIALGDNIVLEARGGSTQIVNGVPVVQVGDLAIYSGGDITVGANSSLSSYGGDVWLNGNNSITIGDGTDIASYAKLDDSHTGQVGGTYTTLPSYTGGRVGILTGSIGTDLSALLDGMVGNRNGNNQIIIPQNPTAFDPVSNTVNASGGSIFQVVFPQGGQKTVTNSTFNLIGGVMFIDPPGVGNDVNINNANITAVGPVLAAPNNGGGNNGGGGGAVLAGSLGAITTDGTLTNTTNNLPSVTLSVGPSSSILSTDTARNTSNPDAPGLQQTIYCATPGHLTSSDTVDDGSWIMASNKCQPFSFEQPDGSIIIGSGPAIFAPSMSRTLLLKEGKLLIIAGEGIIVVRTPVCSITIPVNSAATIEYQADGLARVTSLAGGKSSVTVTRDDETIILSAAPGEQLVLADSSSGPDELTCVPEVTNKKVDTWMIKMSGLRGEKFRFDRSEMVAREELLNCTLGCFSKPQQAMLEQIRQSMIEIRPKEIKTLGSGKRKNNLSMNGVNNHLLAVGFGNVLDLTVPQVNTLTSHTAIVKYTERASIEIETPDTLVMKYGDALISTRKATTVRAGKNVVKLAPGTVAMLAYKDSHLKIRNVYENSNASVTANIEGKKLIGLQAGHEVIIARSGASINKILGEEPVGRRRLKHSEITGSHTIVHSEVSLTSLLQNTNILSQLVRSNVGEDKQLIGKIMKMAVSLSIVTPHHGSYSMVTH
jgi:fibronectin-binding autotransporter adhesin